MIGNPLRDMDKNISKKKHGLLIRAANDGGDYVREGAEREEV